MLRSTFYSIKLLRLALGVFFVVIGVYGVMQGVDEGIFGLNNPSHRSNQNIEVIFGIIELICGLLLLAGLFVFNSFKAIKTGSIIVICFWIGRIILTKIIWGFAIANSGFRFKPDLYTWILSLVTELVILAGLSVIAARYES